MNAPLSASSSRKTPTSRRLGERVRAWRTETRHDAQAARALASGVSERYLAQLEAGRGNISVLLLRKVARAMGVAVERLVRDEDSGAQKPIALIGLRGAGKSTLGEKLAASLELPFVELDREVEKEAGARSPKCSPCTARTPSAASSAARSSACWPKRARAVIATGGSLVTDPGTLRAAARALPLRLAQGVAAGAHGARLAQGDMRPFKGALAPRSTRFASCLPTATASTARAGTVIDTSGKSVRQPLAELERVFA